MVRNDDRNSGNYPLSGGAQVCNARTSFSNGLVFVTSVSFSRSPPFFLFFFVFFDFFVDVYLVKNCGLHENNTEFYFVAISAIDYISKKQTNTYIHCVFTPIKR